MYQTVWRAYCVCGGGGLGFSNFFLSRFECIWFYFHFFQFWVGTYEAALIRSWHLRWKWSWNPLLRSYITLSLLAWGELGFVCKDTWVCVFSSVQYAWWRGRAWDGGDKERGCQRRRQGQRQPRKSNSSLIFLNDTFVMIHLPWWHRSL